MHSLMQKMLWIEMETFLERRTRTSALSIVKLNRLAWGDHKGEGANECQHNPFVTC